MITSNGNSQKPLFSDFPIQESRKSNSNVHALPSSDSVQELVLRLEAIENTLTELVAKLTSQKQAKESYTTKEAAEILGRRPYTVREWCRNGRINAFKPGCGRGAEEEWRVSHEELTRIQNEGLLPQPNKIQERIARKENV